MAPRRSRSDLRPHLDRAGLPPLRKLGRRLIDTVDVETVRAVELALGSEQSVNVFRRDWTHAVASTLGFLDFPNLRIQGESIYFRRLSGRLRSIGHGSQDRLAADDENCVGLEFIGKGP